MKYKHFLLAGLLVFACDNSSNNDNHDSNINGGVNSSSSNSGIISSSGGVSPPLPGSSGSNGNSSNSGNIGDSSGSNNNSSDSGSGYSSSSEEPPVVTAWPKLNAGDPGVKKGWGSRYWDGCKPHCSLRNNVDTNTTNFTICRNCNIKNQEIPTFTLSPNIEVKFREGQIFEDWIGYEETKSSCVQGSQNGIAYVCWDMAPIALNDTLAYAFVAASQKDACGQCFQIQFDGGNHLNDVKEAHRLINGQTMIVMATNTGDDVAGDQFDIMVPGGGPGLFNSFATQMGVDQSLLGEGFGGLLTTCQREINDYDKPAAVFQDCVKNKCNAVFGKPEHKQLLDGCLWFADWYKTADNPTFLYKKVDCPKYFTDKYPSTINKSSHNKIEPYGGFLKDIPSGYEYQKWVW